MTILQNYKTTLSKMNYKYAWKHLMKVNPLLSIFLLWQLAGCASTKVSSHLDAEYAGTVFDRPLVFVSIDRLSHKQSLEDSFVRALNKIGVSAIRGTLLFPPTRNASAQDIFNVFMQSDADSMMLISLKEGSRTVQEFEVKIIGKKIDSLAWVGQSRTEELLENITKDLSLKSMFNSVANGIVSKLVEDDLLVPASGPNRN